MVSEARPENTPSRSGKRFPETNSFMRGGGPHLGDWEDIVRLMPLLPQSTSMELPKDWATVKVHTIMENKSLNQEREILQEVHVVPMNDLREHDLNWDCWCSPDIELEKGPLPIMIHHSKDKREWKEKLNKILN